MTAPYLEAAPRISVFDALRVREHEACLFKDESGRRCGILRVTKMLAEGLSVEYAFYGPGLYQAYERAYLPIASAANSAFPERRMFSCSGCKSPTAILAFNDRWGCRKCSKLRYRSQVIDPDIRAWERKEDLRKDIGKGRPPNMQHRRYARLRKELTTLEKRLARRLHRTPNVNHLKLIMAEWGWSDEHEQEIHAYLEPAPVENMAPADPPLSSPATDVAAPAAHIRPTLHLDY